MENIKYKVTNTTVKPVRRDIHGADTRPAVERVGHPVKFKDGDADNAPDRILQSGQHCIVSHVNSGLLGLQRGGFVRIEKIDDISTALREHAYDGKAVQTRTKPKRKATAVEMGKDTYSQRSGSEHEGAVNPDGDPNFLVKAKRGGTGRAKRKGLANVSGSGNDKAAQ